MGNKVIIVVRHEAMLSAQVAQVSARWASPVHSALAAYQGRRIALKQLAEDLLRPTPNTTQHAVTELNSVDMAVSFDAEPAAPASVTVLEGLGVLIVDEALIDVASLADVDVLRVWPNMELTLADPAIGQGTAPWHIAHDLPIRFLENRRLLAALFKTIRAARRKTAAFRRVHQTWRLPSNEHRV